MDFKKGILLTLAVFCFVRCNGLVCKNGYSIHITNTANCDGPNGIISLTDGAAVIVNDDCSLSLAGCLKVNSFNTASGNILIAKNGNKLFSKSIDLCDPVVQETVVAQFLPLVVCPMEENEICGDPNMKLPVQRMLPMLKGTVVIEMNFQHDTGNSCIKIEAEVSK